MLIGVGDLGCDGGELFVGVLYVEATCNQLGRACLSGAQIVVDQPPRDGVGQRAAVADDAHRHGTFWPTPS